MKNDTIVKYKEELNKLISSYDNLLKERKTIDNKMMKCEKDTINFAKNIVKDLENNFKVFPKEVVEDIIIQKFISNIDSIILSLKNAGNDISKYNEGKSLAKHMVLYIESFQNIRTTLSKYKNTHKCLTNTSNMVDATIDTIRSYNSLLTYEEGTNIIPRTNDLISYMRERIDDIVVMVSGEKETPIPTPKSNDDMTREAIANTIPASLSCIASHLEASTNKVEEDDTPEYKAQVLIEKFENTYETILDKYMKKNSESPIEDVHRDSIPQITKLVESIAFVSYELDNGESLEYALSKIQNLLLEIRMIDYRGTNIRAFKYDVIVEIKKTISEIEKLV